MLKWKGWLSPARCERNVEKRISHKTPANFPFPPSPFRRNVYIENSLLKSSTPSPCPPYTTYKLTRQTSQGRNFAFPFLSYQYLSHLRENWKIWVIYFIYECIDSFVAQDPEVMTHAFKQLWTSSGGRDVRREWCWDD